MNIYTLVRKQLTIKWRLISLVLVMIVISKALTLTLPFFLKFTVDSFDTEVGSDAWIYSYAPGIVLFYVFVFLLSGVIDELKEYYGEKSIQPAITAIAEKIYNHTLYLPIDFFLDQKSGSILKNLERGIRALQTLSSLFLYTILPLIIEICGVIFVLFFSYSFSYSIILLSGISAYIFLTLYLTNNLVTARYELNKTDSLIAGHIGESINNFESIKIFFSANKELNKLKYLHITYIEKVISFQFLHSKLKIIQKIIVAITIAAILYLAAKEVLANQLTKGDFILLSAFAFQVFMPISSMGILWKDFQQNLADIVQIQEIYKKAPAIQYSSDSPESKTDYYAEPYPPSISFQNVSYRYPNGNLAIDNISFEIASGSFVGIVGDNGSGKSTLLRLMLGLIQPTSGTILINGEPVEADALRKLSSMIGVVPQNISLFHGSISDNIFYNSESTKTDFHTLLKLVNLDKDIAEKLTEGIDTQVGEKGLKLSGGQRQKVAIARALSNNPKLLILDEPSSALDERSEGITFIEKEQILKNRTVILITHNRNLLKNASLILEISKGKLID